MDKSACPLPASSHGSWGLKSPPHACPTDQVVSLAQEATFLNNGHIFIYVVAFIYPVPECGVTAMLKEESGSEQQNVGRSLHHGARLLLYLCLFFIFFDYLFIFILLQTMTAYLLVAAG